MLFICAKNDSINGIVHNSSSTVDFKIIRKLIKSFITLLLRFKNINRTFHVPGLTRKGNAEHILQNKKSVPSEDSDQSAYP